MSGALKGAALNGGGVKARYLEARLP